MRAADSETEECVEAKTEKCVLTTFLFNAHVQPYQFDDSHFKKW